MASHCTLSLHLDEGFNDDLQKEMKNELKEASFKWGVKLTEKQKVEILKRSVDQVRFRVVSVSGNPWNLENKIDFKMNGLQKNISVSHDDQKIPNIQLIRARDSWIVDNDVSEKSVALKDFYQHFKQEVMTWARTAVFYGVGSYKS